MNAWMQHVQFEFKSIFRDKSLLLMYYLFPLAFFFMMAFIMPSVFPDFEKVMVPGMIVFSVMVTTLLGLPNMIVSAREKGIYRSYKIYGVDVKSMLWIPFITTAIHMTIVTVIILMSSAFIFSSSMPVNYLYFFISYIIMMIAFLGIGITIGICVPNEKMTVLPAQLIFIPSMIIGGVMMPTDMLPPTVQKIANILPSTHSVELLFQSAFTSQMFQGLTSEIIVLLASSLLSFVLSAYLFTWDQGAYKPAKSLFGLLVLLPFVIAIFI